MVMRHKWKIPAKRLSVCSRMHFLFVLGVLEGFAPVLTAMTVTTGTRWPWYVIAIGSAFNEKGQQKQCKDKCGSRQYKNKLRHLPLC